MAKYLVEIDESTNKILSENAKLRNLSIESIITEIVNRFAVPAHSIQCEEELKKGYIESGDVNLDWSNL